MCLSFKFCLHSLQYAHCARLVCCYCDSSTQFLKTIILQGIQGIVVVTHFMCGKTVRYVINLYCKLFAMSYM